MIFIMYIGLKESSFFVSMFFLCQHRFVKVVRVVLADQLVSFCDMLGMINLFQGILLQLFVTPKSSLFQVCP